MIGHKYTPTVGHTGSYAFGDHVRRNLGATVVELGIPPALAVGSVKELVNHLLIEVFSFIAQEERENIRRRQAEGIALWRKTEKTKTGRPYGRPKIKLPSNWKKIYSLRKEKKLKTKEAWFLLKISKNVFNVIMWMLKSGVRGRDLPSRYGNWNSIYPNLARIPPPL